MRIFLFALMIALLPLRGFAGDVMATEMAIQMTAQAAAEMAAAHLQPGSGPSHPTDATDATKNVAAHADHSGASAHFDSHHETTAAQEAAMSGNACAGHVAAEQCHSSDTHGSCQACQACHTVALSLASTQVEPVFASSGLPHLAAAQFASAEAALGQKPPIS